MPATPDNRQIGSKLLNESRKLEPVADSGAGQGRYARTEQALGVIAKPRAPVDIPFCVNNFDVVSCFKQRPGEREMR